MAVVRTQLLAAMAALCGVVMGCNCSPYAGMKYEGCGCGPGSWAPANGCGLTSCGSDVQGGSGCDCGCHVGFLDGCACECGGGLFSGRVLSALCECSGCVGDVYWSEWHNNPPGCEPCDCCGNYTGANCCVSGCCDAPSCAGPYAMETGRSDPASYMGDDVEVAVFTGDMVDAIDAAFDAYQAEFDDTEAPEYEEPPLR